MKQLNDNSLIKVENISKEFVSGNSAIKVLDNVSFSVPEGSFTIIHGPSGSGKTTLLNTIAGLEKPTQGEVLYKSKPIYDLTPGELAHFRAKTLGIVYQTNYFVKSLNVLENVALPLYFLGYTKSNAEHEALESLKRVGMEANAKKLTSILSGGEQQRISMARALVSNPTYIVADEPTGNLDSKNGRAIIDLLKYCNEDLGRTVILITHNLEYLPMGTQTIEVLDGKVTASRQRAEKIDSVNKHVVQSRMGNVTKGLALAKGALSPVKLRILFHMALVNLKFKRLRSVLTILGVVIGVGSIFLLLTFGLGLQQLVQGDIIGADSTKIIDVSSINTDLLKFDEKSISRIQNIPHVEKIGRLNTSAGKVQFEGANSDAVVYGVDKNYLKLTNMTMIEGRALDVTTNDEVLINRSLLDTLDYKDYKKALGRPVTLSLKLIAGDKAIKHPFKVVGVIESGSGSVLYIPGNVYRTAGEKIFQQVKVSVDKTGNIPNVRQQLEGFGYKTVSPLDTIDQVNRFFRFFNAILVSFGGIGMLIAVLGMLNTLTISLLERTKEIGLMVTLGGRQRDMKKLFITESLLLSFIGGVVGIIGATLVGFAVDVVLNQVSSSRGVAGRFSLFSTPLSLIVIVLVFVLVVGLLVSYIPAKRAAKISPIDALRNE